jgi:hypothetical protein
MKDILRLPGAISNASSGQVAPRPCWASLVWERGKCMIKDPTDKIQIHFDRQNNVERINFSCLIDTYNPNRMNAEALRRYYDSAQLLFKGYHDDPRFPFLIPEIRRFQRKLHTVWPYAPFFCDLDTFFIAIEAFSQLDDLVVVEADGSDEVLFKINSFQLHRYVKQSRRTIRMLGSRARLNAREIRDRITRVDDYIFKRCGPFPGRRK